jgi:hypothetical protein
MVASLVFVRLEIQGVVAVMVFKLARKDLGDLVMAVIVVVYQAQFIVIAILYPSVRLTVVFVRVIVIVSLALVCAYQEVI